MSRRDVVPRMTSSSDCRTRSWTMMKSGLRSAERSMFMMMSESAMPMAASCRFWLGTLRCRVTMHTAMSRRTSRSRACRRWKQDRCRLRIIDCQTRARASADVHSIASRDMFHRKAYVSLYARGWSAPACLGRARYHAGQVRGPATGCRSVRCWRPLSWPDTRDPAASHLSATCQMSL